MRFELSEDQQALSEKNKVNSSQNDNPHRTVSRGYLRKISEREKQQEHLIKSGVKLQIDGWNPRSVRHLLARGASYNSNGSLKLQYSFSRGSSASNSIGPLVS